MCVCVCAFVRETLWLCLLGVIMTQLILLVVEYCEKGQMYLFVRGERIMMMLLVVGRITTKNIIIMLSFEQNRYKLLYIVYIVYKVTRHVPDDPSTIP